METFTFPYQVTYGDTDAAGVVYYARYLEIMERARWAWLEAHGLAMAELHRAGHWFVVAEAHLRYRRPAPLGARLTVGVTVERVGRASLTVGQPVRGDDGTGFVEATIRLGCVEPTGKVSPLPPEVVRALARERDF